jgi:hypothetical protein
MAASPPPLIGPTVSQTMSRVNSKLIITHAKRILAGQVHMVIGVRAICAELDDALSFDPRFTIFVLVDSEADPFPVTPSVRALWNPEALQESDARYDIAVAGYKPDVDTACNELIKLLTKAG